MPFISFRRFSYPISGLSGQGSGYRHFPESAQQPKTPMIPMKVLSAPKRLAPENFTAITPLLNQDLILPGSCQKTHPLKQDTTG